jgi:hypothetical protein
LKETQLVIKVVLMDEQLFSTQLEVIRNDELFHVAVKSRYILDHPISSSFSSNDLD